MSAIKNNIFKLKLAAKQHKNKAVNNKELSLKNLLAIELLECMGNSTPSQEEINHAEELLDQFDVKKQQVLQANMLITAREKAILTAYADGLADKQIAAKLSFSTRYLGKIKRDIYQKTGCKTMPQVIYEYSDCL